MKHEVTAQAFANIALVKYWGKRDDRSKIPATPSISLGLKALKTVTTVRSLGGGVEDLVELDGKVADAKTQKRISEYLSLWRDEGLLKGHFQVISRNEFPTASGLASSASGFAALAMALSGFANRKISRTELSRLARKGSGSAARSIHGGLVAFPNTEEPAAKPLLAPEDVSFGMVVAQVNSTHKEIGSTEGMRLSRETSPYYEAWVQTAKHDYQRIIDLVVDGPRIHTIGSIVELNALAMHACMIATRPSLLYWTPPTVELLHCVKQWRQDGLSAYATIDAGPHVCFLARLEDLDEIAERTREVSGVVNVFTSEPAPPAEILSWK